MERALWTLQSAAKNQGVNDPIRWDVVNAALMNAGAPSLGSDDNDDSYNAFAARWDNPDEGEVLKRFVDRFDGNGIVLKTGDNEEQPMQQGKEKTGAVDQMAKRATQKAFK